MNDPRTVSVVIPCYNNERYVGGTIESVLQQDYPDIDIVVVDDGSTDNSLGEIRRFDDHVKILSTPNRGAPAARNTGMEKASGVLIKFLDADDQLFEGAIRRQVNQYADIKKKTVVFGEGVWFYESGRAFRRTLREREPEEDPLMYILDMNPQTSLSLYPRPLLEDVGGFDEELERYQDLDLNVRISLAGGEHQYAPVDITMIRMHDGEDRISKQSILEKQPYHALRRLEKWVGIIEDQNRMGSEIRREIAQRAWRKGRAVLRAGQAETANRYFDFARGLHDAPLADTSQAYRVSATLLGPQAAELIAKVARKTGLTGRNRNRNGFRQSTRSEEMGDKMPASEEER